MCCCLRAVTPGVAPLRTLSCLFVLVRVLQYTDEFVKTSRNAGLVWVYMATIFIGAALVLAAGGCNVFIPTLTVSR